MGDIDIEAADQRSEDVRWGEPLVGGTDALLVEGHLRGSLQLAIAPRIDSVFVVKIPSKDFLRFREILIGEPTAQRPVGPPAEQPPYLRRRQHAAFSFRFHHCITFLVRGFLGRAFVFFVGGNSSNRSLNVTSCTRTIFF